MADHGLILGRPFAFQGGGGVDIPASTHDPRCQRCRCPGNRFPTLYVLCFACYHRIMGIDNDVIEEIVRRILTISRPVRVILFGSAAAGTMTPDSDIDLLVVQRAPGDVREQGIRIRRAFRGLGYPFDIVVMDVERFEESKDVVGGLAWPATRYGKVIYEAA